MGGQVERERGDWSFRGDEVVTVLEGGQVRSEADYEGAHEFDRLQGSVWVQDEWEATSRLTVHGRNREIQKGAFRLRDGQGLGQISTRPAHPLRFDRQDRGIPGKGK
jgi:hypothetical protein